MRGGRLHSERTAAVLGLCLGVTFTVCFLTGLLSHLIQHPPSWLRYPPRPLNLYRVTQGVHVVTGVASIPLLLAKLYTVSPKFWRWPPVESIGHAVERAALVPLVAGALFQLWSGVANIYYWYTPMPFNFTVVHFWAAWITVGALVIHVGAKFGIARLALRRGAADGEGSASDESVALRESPAAGESTTDGGTALSRRDLLIASGATSAVLAASVAGETLVPLKVVAILAPRDITKGPQKLPVNQSALQANVSAQATDPSYRLKVTGRVPRDLHLSRTQLLAMPARGAGLPITCVEGWSVAASWTGVSLSRILDAAGARRGSSVEVVSLQAPDRLYRSSVVNPGEVDDPDTMLAYHLNGEVLDLDHGYPVRLIGANRPGVMQTK